MTTKTQLVLEGYQAGLQPAEIAKRIGSTTASVKVLACKLGVTRSHRERWAIRRGFDVPPEKAADYRYLIDHKGYSSREAGAILGLFS